LQGVDELRVKARGHLNTHTTCKETKVHYSQIWFPIPLDCVFGGDMSDDGVRNTLDMRGEIDMRSHGAANWEYFFFLIFDKIVLIVKEKRSSKLDYL